MAKPRIKNNRSHLLKYTFPVVRAAIESLGPPREITKLPPKQQGPLIVTLTTDIAADCAREIIKKQETLLVSKSEVTLDCMIPDLFEGPITRSRGVSQLLVQHNLRWWTKFAIVCEKKFQKLAESRGPLTILLRSSFACSFAGDEESKVRINYDSIFSEIARNPQKHLSIPFISAGLYNSATIRKWRSLLREEDNKQKDWIKQLTGGCHPCTSSYNHENPIIKQKYSAFRASNELYYCIAQGTVGWRLAFSDNFTVEEWERWLIMAQTGAPQYWEPDRETVVTRQYKTRKNVKK